MNVKCLLVEKSKEEANRKSKCGFWHVDMSHGTKILVKKVQQCTKCNQTESRIKRFVFIMLRRSWKRIEHILWCCNRCPMFHEIRNRYSFILLEKKCIFPKCIAIEQYSKQELVDWKWKRSMATAYWADISCETIQFQVYFVRFCAIAISFHVLLTVDLFCVTQSISIAEALHRFFLLYFAQKLSQT